MVEAESGLGCFLYPLRSGKHLHRILAAAKYLGSTLKCFGLTALTLIFTLLSGIYIYRHMPQEDKS
ncbi:putative intracellular septation protein [Escherichia coli]|uniref:Putative intracellular septation protein n=1 Tax=Escherichia coli TaxID=562 RepID=A0A376MXG9_ECOLX|nr:putative intracellular septation protein [Escherichia coli]